MKSIFVLFLIVFILFSPVLPGNETNQPEGTFMLHENTPVYLSLEHYKSKDGWTPLVLSAGGIDCLLWMDDWGRVSEWRGIQDHGFAPLCLLDSLNQTLGKGADLLYFDVYEQNPVRSRWRLSSYDVPGQWAITIRFRSDGIDFYMEGLRLSLRQVSCDPREISPGIFLVQLNGPILAQHQSLIFEKNTGIIYSTHPGNTTLIPGQSHTWAMKHESPGKPIIGGK